VAPPHPYDRWSAAPRYWIDTEALLHALRPAVDTRLRVGPGGATALLALGTALLLSLAPPGTSVAHLDGPPPAAGAGR
jgi:hypothetical protein